MRRPRGPWLLCWMLLTACGDDSSVGGSSEGESSEGDSSGGGSSTSSSPDSSSTDSGADGSSSDDGSTTELEFARDIRLLRVTANQGVQVVLVRDGVEVPAEEQPARLIGGRRTLIRGLWQLHANFEPRPLVGQLTITYPDGREVVQETEVMVEGESSDGGASFNWILEAEDVVADMRFRVRVLEPDPGLTTGTISDPPPVAPLASAGTLPIYDVPLRLEVVLVPVLHQFDGCERMPEITEVDVEAMRQELEQLNPVQQANLTVREPMPYTETIGASESGFSPVLAALAAARAADDPPENVYYYGLLDPCDGFPPGLGGQAIDIPDAPTKENAQLRVATGRWYGGGAGAAGTFVHEIGHTQGRYHVRCSGGEAGADVAYPHSGGSIGVWGYGIHDTLLRTPVSARDYMTYCPNEWVSDYGWNFTLETIETLTSWDAEDASSRPQGTVLVGVLHEDGTSDWWTARGGMPTPTAGALVTFELAGAAPLAFPAFVSELPHGTAKHVIAPFPAEFERVAAFRVHEHDRSHAIDSSAVRIIRR